MAGAPRNPMNRRTVLQLAGVAAASFLVGRTHQAKDAAHPAIVRAAGDSPDATATRAAERNELDGMRTQIANPSACVLPTETATVSATATATLPPPSPAGATVRYSDTWEINVLSIAPAILPDSISPVGTVLQVNYELHNLTQDSALPPFVQFTLSDHVGTTVQVDIALNQTLFGSTGVLPVNGYATDSRSVAFDFPTKGGTQYIFGSSAAPGFRVALEIVNRN